MSQPHSFAMPTKDSVTEVDRSAASRHARETDTLQTWNHTEMHFIKVQSALFATTTNATKIGPLYCTLLATLLTSTQATIIPLV